jgi:hypothetical protein
MRYDDDEAYVDVFANARRENTTENTTGRSLVRRELLGKEIIKQQRELLDCEARRADEAERELERVCAHADALSRRLDEISMAFAVSRRRRRRSGSSSSSSSDEDEVEDNRHRGGRRNASELSAQNSRLQIENDRLRRDIEEMETRHRRELSEAKKMSALTSTGGDAFTAEERRALLREIAEARKEIAVAKEARAKALSEAIDLRTKLEAEQLRSSSSTTTTTTTKETTPPRTPEWANIDWDAAYAEMDAVKASKAASRLAAEKQPAQQKQEWEKIDWDAAYAEMDATRAANK